MLPRNRLSRFERVKETKTARGAGLAEMINAAASREAPAEVPAAKPKATAPPPEPVKTPRPSAAAAPLDPEPSPPRAPPPEPQWWEEKLGWRSRGMPPPHYYDDGVRYETIHEYDPMEWAEREEDYD